MPARLTRSAGWVPTAAVVAVATTGLVAGVLFTVGMLGGRGIAGGTRLVAAVPCPVGPAAQRVRTLHDGTVTVGLLGDSWSSGWKLPSYAEDYAVRLARLRHWDLTVAAVPGTGYVNPGRCGHAPFASRVDRLPADAALVVVEGGLNDEQDDRQLTALPAAARATLAAVHRRAPYAEVVVLGPPHVPLHASAREARGTRILARAAADAHAHFVDAASWRLPYLPDRIHLTPAGHARFADLLDRSLPQVPAR